MAVPTVLPGGGGLRGHRVYHERRSPLPILPSVELLGLQGKGDGAQAAHSKYRGFPLMEWVYLHPSSHKAACSRVMQVLGFLFFREIVNSGGSRLLFISF